MQATVNSVDEFLSTKYDNNWKLPDKSETPLQTIYLLELNLPPELGPNEEAYYMSLIGMMRWMFEIRQVDI